MRYSTKPKYRKYVEGYGFLSVARKLGGKYGINAAKTAFKRVVQKTVVLDSIKMEHQNINPLDSNLKYC